MNQHDFSKAYIAYGVREHAMFAIANGLALSGLLPFVGTFLTFMDYGRNSLRMSALMKLRVIYVLTHDSIGLGEDGPTHQPIEHLTMCRATPGVRLWRPCNLAETTVAWLDALAYDGPTVLALSRQKIDAIKACDTIDQVFQGAYQLVSAQKPQLVILATGSEVSIAMDVAKLLAQKQIFADVVSVPCLDKLNTAESVDDIIRLPRTHCFVIEAGSGLSWHRWAPPENLFCIDEFGHSAKAPDLYRHFGLDAQNVSVKIQQQLLEGKS
jgi:transketolase